MKLIVEPCSKNIDYIKKVDGLILAIEDFSVESICSFSIDDIIDIKRKNNCLVFVKMNKNLFNCFLIIGLISKYYFI